MEPLGWPSDREAFWTPARLQTMHHETMRLLHHPSPFDHV